MAPPFPVRFAGGWVATGGRGSPGVMGEDRKMPDTAHRRMPLVTLVRTFGGFKMSTPQSRQDRLLATLDPLALGKSSAPQLLSAQQPEPYYVQEDVWGDQEPLSKVRLTLRAKGEEAWSLHAWRGCSGP